MDPMTLAVVAVGVVLGAGLYNKTHTSTSLAEAAGSAATSVFRGQDTSSVEVSRAEIARVLQQTPLPPGDVIIQVYAYASVSRADGILHTVDAMVSNMATTQTLARRLRILQSGSNIKLLEAELVTPVVGEERTFASLQPSSTYISSTSIASEGSDVVADEAHFAYIEPIASRPAALPANASEEDRAIYRANLKSYEERFMTERTMPAPTTALEPYITIKPDYECYPLGEVGSYGFAEASRAPIDYSVLHKIQPLQDEAFYNSVAYERSAARFLYQ